MQDDVVQSIKSAAIALCSTEGSGIQHVAQCRRDERSRRDVVTVSWQLAGIATGRRDWGWARDGSWGQGDGNGAAGYRQPTNVSQCAWPA